MEEGRKEKIDREGRLEERKRVRQEERKKVSLALRETGKKQDFDK